MDDPKGVKKEAEVDADPDAHGAHKKVKREQEAAKDDDENENTPFRGERSDLAEPIVADAGRAGWSSDEDQGGSVTDNAESTIPALNIKKRSPSNDNELTPKRLSNTALDEHEAEVRIKPETVPEAQPDESENENGMDLPDNFFDELLEIAEELKPINKHEEPQIRNDLSKDLDFLDNYTEADFEGVTNAYSKVEDLDNMELAPNENENLAAEIEAKIKELEKLQKKAKKKHKDKKLKKRRRSRSQSPNPKERRTNTSSGLCHISAATHIKPEHAELDYVPVRESERSVKITNISKLMHKEAAAPITIKEKRRLAVERVTAVLNLMRQQSLKEPAKEFLVVDTIKQLPSRTSYMSCGIFENPSPLCKNYNIKYKFSSTTFSNKMMSKWGLEPMPVVTTKLLRLTGIDVLRLMELQLNSKMPLQKLRMKQEAEKAANPAEAESFSTGLYKSVATQTEARIRNNTRDAGIQASIATVSHHNGIFWLDSGFNETDLSQQHTNVMLALKELCVAMPRSTFWADELFRSLKMALAIKRAENRELAN